MIMHLLLENDQAPENIKEALDLKGDVLDIIMGKPGVSCYDIYSSTGCGDIPLYLVLHQLVISGAVMGISPYDEDPPQSMGEWVYTAHFSQLLPF